MLTSVYYYGYYKPYILNHVPKIGEGGRKINADKSADPATRETFVLNNSLKREVIRYASGLSGTVNDLRETSKDVLQDIFSFKRTVMDKDFNYAKEELADDLSDFTNAYNRNLKFTHKDANSRPFKSFVDDLAYDVSISTTALSKYGITVADDDTMSFDREFFSKLRGRELGEANKANHALVKNIYDSTGEFLTLPLAEHMKFKNLGYYYNYKLGTMEKDSFKLIQSGMIVDRVV
jgi:hypothetical protein